MADKPIEDSKKLSEEEKKKSRRIVLEFINESDPAPAKIEEKRVPASSPSEKSVPLPVKVKEINLLKPALPSPAKPAEKKKPKKKKQPKDKGEEKKEKKAKPEIKMAPWAPPALKPQPKKEQAAPPPAKTKIKDELFRREAAKREEERKIITEQRALELRKERRKKLKSKLSGLLDFFRLFGRYFVYLLSFLLPLFVLAYFIFSFILFNFYPDRPVARRLAGAVPVPAIISTVGLVEFYDYLDVKKEIEYQLSAFENKKISQNVLAEIAKNMTVKEKLAGKLAGRYGLVVEEREVEEAFKQILKLNLSGRELETTMQKVMGSYYHLGQERFKERVIRPKILLSKLATAIVRDKNLNARAWSKINEADARLKAGEEPGQFKAPDGYQASGLLYYSSSEIVKKFGAGVTGLKAGEISEVIINPEGYYLVKVQEITDDLYGIDYVFVKARTLDEYLSEEFKRVKIINFAG